MKGTVLILGAHSDIALAMAYMFASEGYSLQLAGRDTKNLDADKCNLELRYKISASIHEFDALHISSHAEFVKGLPRLPDIAVCTVGYMGEQSSSECDVQAAALVMRSNYEGPCSIFAELASQFEQRGSGTLVGFSSVAGERGRATNYIYGSAKAGFTAFLSGLRNRLVKKGVHVMTVLPGFVATRMTEKMKLPPRLTAEPQQVATAVFEGIQMKRDVVYVKPIWRFIMLIIRNIPERIFKFLPL